MHDKAMVRGRQRSKTCLFAQDRNGLFAECLMIQPMLLGMIPNNVIVIQPSVPHAKRHQKTFLIQKHRAEMVQ